MVLSIADSMIGKGRASLRPAVQGVRAVLPYVASEWSRRGRGPRVAFLPVEGRSQSSLLRIYNIAKALGPLGWRGLVLPHKLTLQQRLVLLRRFRPRLVVMQGARHELNRPELYSDYPVLYDLDDADFHLPHLEGVVRRAMPQVRGVIAGSGYIADWCLAAGAPRADVVWTGTPVSTVPRTAHRRRSKVIAWAQTRPMTYDREAEWVRGLCGRLAQRHSGLTLRLYDRVAGDDPGFAASFQVHGLTVEWRKRMPYRDYLATFDDVALGLAPLSSETPFSRGKSFGKILAYLDRGVPVLASDVGEPCAFFSRSSGVVSNDFEAWIEAADRLLGDTAARDAMAASAFAAFQDRLSVAAAAGNVDRVLRNSLKHLT